jgi:uncharacterized SAM-binding protein YcdF (DUF218 family)
VGVERFVETVWRYHQLRHPLVKADAILVLCSHDKMVAEHGAQLFLDGWAPLLIFSGGLGAITKTMWREPEADQFATIAAGMGVPRDRILVENRSTNTGENVHFTRALLREHGLDPRSFIVVQKPYMERRSFATFKKVWPEKEVIVSSPDVTLDQYLARYSNDTLTKDDVVSIMVGDLERVKVYPEKGFQIHQDIPADVWEAFEALVAAGYDRHLIQTSRKGDVMTSPSPSPQAWPALPLDAWSDTCATLHMWLQIAGKVRLTKSAPINHGWHSTFYVTSRGITTSPIPDEARTFQIDFDFIDHALVLQTSDGATKRMPLEPQTVSSFYKRLMDGLHALNVDVHIHGKPNEVPDPIPFDRDETHRAYDAEYVNRFWRVLVQSDRVFKKFRSGFIGKCSPVHLFWGALDLAVTRFSGRRAPEHPGGIPNLPDRITREAYSHEVSSCGFWAGGGAIAYPAYYAYAYPEPEGFGSAKVQPREAFYSADYREFILPYDVVRQSKDPDATLLEFLQSTYEAAADLGRWDRAALELPGA